MMYDQSLHILVVDNDSSSLLLLEAALEEVRTPKFALTGASRLDEALRCLHDQRFNAVLLHLGLPDSQGLETFVRMQRQYPALPILILSGCGDEDLAIQAVQGGAQDFVPKDDISGVLLSRSIRYAIERKHSEQRLVASEASYRRLFETARDGIFILDAGSGQITDANPYLEEMLGYTLTEFIGKRLWEIAPFRDQAANQAAFRTLQEKGYIRYDDLPLMTRDGKIANVEFVSNVYEVGSQQVIQCNIRDITKRKQAAVAEQELKRFFQSTLDALPAHIAVLDESGQIIAVNQAWRQFFAANGGTDASCGVGANYLEICEKTSGPRAEEGSEVGQGIQSVLRAQHEAFCLEYPCHSPTEERWFNVCVTPFAGEGPVRVVVAHENITTRKQAENSIRTSEINLAKSQQMTHLGSWELDLTNLADINANPLRWSDEIYRILGYTPGEFEPSNEAFFRAVHPDDRATLSRIMAEAVQGGKPYSVEHRIILPDGRERVIHAQAEVFFHEETGHPSKMVGLGQDITERKQAEEALRKNETKFRTVFETALDAILLANDDGVYVDANPAACTLLGLEHHQLIGSGVADFVSPATQDPTRAAWEDFLRNGHQSGEFEFRQPNGTLRQAEYRAVAGLLPGIHMSILRDVTERKQAERALQKSEQEQRQFAEHLERERARLAEAQAVAKVGSWELDSSTGALIWSDENYRIFGVDRNRFGASYQAFLELIHPDDRAAVHEAYTTSVANRTPYTIDHRLQMEDGSFKIVHERCQTFYDDQGQPIRSVGTTQDITQRKQDEAALEARTREIVTTWESMTDAFFSLDLQWRFTHVNSQAASLMHSSAEAMKGGNLWEQFPGAVGLRFDTEFHRAVEQQTVVDFEEFFPLYNAWYEVHAYPSPLGLAVYFRDVTERKLAEASLRESEERFRAVFDQAAVGICVVGMDYCFQRVNECFCEILGYSSNELIGSGNCVDTTHPDDRAADAASVARLLAGEESVTLEKRYICKNGRVVWARLTLSLMRSLGGQPQQFIGVISDITERRLAEDDLRASEARFQTFMDNSPAIAFIIDEQSRFVYMNQPFKQQMGIEFSAQPNLSVFDVWPQEIAQTMHEQNMSVLAGNLFVPLVMAIPDAGGEVQHWATWKFLLLNPSGRRFVAGFALDVTEEERIALALRESEERFQSIVANVPGMVYQYVMYADGALELPFVSQGCRDIYETEPETLRNNPFWPSEQVHPDDLSAHDRSIAASAETLSPWRHEYRIRLESGKTKWIQGAARPQRLPNGSTVWDGLLTDISARKEAEEERDRFFTLSLDMLAIIGNDGHFKRLNPAFETTLGFSEAELLAVPFIEFVHPDDRAATLEQDAKLESGSQVMRFENRYRCRDGSYKWLLWMCAPFEDLFYCVAHDVTAMREAEAALQQANGELEARVRERTAELVSANESLRVENIEHQMTLEILQEVAEALQKAKEEADTANAAKSEFLSRMSHELRTPLNAILGFGQILENQDLPPRSSESVAYILKGGRHLLDLINEVLDIARVEAGHVELSLEPIALGEIVPEACALMQPLAAKRNIYLSENTAKLGHAHVLADRQRLKQVLINLVSNAIKYNREAGQVEVRCEQQPNGRISIAVIDTGPGILPQNLPKLFTPFERLNAANLQVEGTGLGLVLSQRMVTAMGGTLTVESTLGRGTTFTVELPAVSPSPVQEQLTNLAEATDFGDSRQEAQGTYCVLCIEDNPSNLRLMEALFEIRPEITLLTAIQGSIGLDLAHQHEPDLILLDLNLPDLHGKEVLARLQQSALTRDIPVVVTSADATPNQVKQLLAAGAKEYLTKPLDVGQFFATLNQFLYDKNSGSH